jgi:hypothetical protein
LAPRRDLATWAVLYSTSPVTLALVLAVVLVPAVGAVTVGGLRAGNVVNGTGTIGPAPKSKRPRDCRPDVPDPITKLHGELTRPSAMMPTPTGTSVGDITPTNATNLGFQMNIRTAAAPRWRP